MTPKGFKGKYFSLAAILAFSTTTTLCATQVSQELHVEQKYANESSENEEEDLPTMVISRKMGLAKNSLMSASNALQNRANVTDNATVITSNELSLMGAKTVIEALNYVSGFSSSANGGLGQLNTIRLQGMDGKHILVLVNGVKYANPFDTSGANLSNLMIDDVERIEVIKGAQSAVWGANASAGVINIITKKEYKTSAFIGGEIGNYGFKKGSLGVSYANEKLNASLRVLRVVSKELSAVSPRGENPNQYEKDPYRNTTVEFNGGYWINSDNRIELNYLNINAFSHYDAHSDPITWAIDPNSLGSVSYKEQMGSFRYMYYIGSHLLSLSASKTHVKVDRFDLPNQAKQDNRGDVLSFELKDEFRYGENSILILGANHEEQKIEHNSSGMWENKKRKTNSLNASNTYSWSGFNFTTALRYDDPEDFNSKVTYKLGISYNVNEEVSVYANFGTAYRAPYLTEINNPWGDSNFDLKPESIKSFNVGARAYGFSVNFFQNEIKDRIDWASDPITWVGRYENFIGISKFKGVELGYEKTLYEKFLVGLNYTYTDAKDSQDVRLPRIPLYKVGVLLSYMPTQELKLSLFGNYIGKREDGFAKVATGRYFLANAKVDYEVNKNLDIYTTLNNLFNKEYQEVDGYATKKFNFTVGFRAKY